MDNRNDTFIGSRWFYAICFAGLFVVETLIALFVRDAFIRPYMGDVLVVYSYIALCVCLLPAHCDGCHYGYSCLLVVLKRYSICNWLLYWGCKIVRWQG